MAVITDTATLGAKRRPPLGREDMGKQAKPHTHAVGELMARLETSVYGAQREAAGVDMAGAGLERREEMASRPLSMLPEREMAPDLSYKPELATPTVQAVFPRLAGVYKRRGMA